MPDWPAISELQHQLKPSTATQIPCLSLKAGCLCAVFHHFVVYRRQNRGGGAGRGGWSQCTDLWSRIPSAPNIALTTFEAGIIVLSLPWHRFCVLQPYCLLCFRPLNTGRGKAGANAKSSLRVSKLVDVLVGTETGGDQRLLA